MVRRSTSLKKFISTVVDRISPHIENKDYSLEDQKILKNFRILLENCVLKTGIARSSLSDELETYYQKTIKNELYYSTAFLWFSADFFNTANLFLNVADYHAEDYYTYLTKHLRTNSEIKGAFHLIQEHTPLIDLQWERLQYAAIEPPPLTQEELDRIGAINSLIQNEGIKSLNPTRIRSHIRESTDLDPPRHLNRFFHPLSVKWFLWFYNPAFSIEQIIFRIKLTSYESFKQVFDYSDQKNTTLCMSRIFQNRNSLKSYLGSVFIPNHLQNNFLKYLEGLQEKGKLILEEFSRVTDPRFSNSTNLYKPGTGWSAIKKEELRRIIHHLNDESDVVNDNENPSFFLSTRFNTNWKFRKHTNAIHAVQVYCDLPEEYSFDSLPFSIKPIPSCFKHAFTKREKAHLKEMYNNHVVQPFIQVQRLQDAFSLDRYWLQFSNVSLPRLYCLLSYLPVCSIFITDSCIYLLTRLTQELLHEIETSLNALTINFDYEIISVMHHNPSQIQNSNWFDFESLQWRSPAILQS